MQAVKYRISLCVYIIIFRITHILGLRGCSMLYLIIINYCCPVKPRLRDFSSRNPSKYGTWSLFLKSNPYSSIKEASLSVYQVVSAYACLVAHPSLLMRNQPREVRCPQRTTSDNELLLFSVSGNYRLPAKGSGPHGQLSLSGLSVFCERKLSTRANPFFMFSC